MGKVRQVGMPQIGKALQRERLLSVLMSADTHVIALVAPFGFGKTTLAVDYVSQLGGDVIWVALDGRGVDCAQVLRRIADQLDLPIASNRDKRLDLAKVTASVAEHLQGATTLVLDDVDVSSDGGDAGLDGLLRILRPLFDRIVLTMDEASGSDLLALRDALVLDRQHLALSQAELVEVFGHKGLDVHSYGDAEALLREAGGNASFAALLLASRDDAAGLGTIAPCISTQAMLEAALFYRESSEEAELLNYACMLGECTFGELQLLGLADARKRLHAIARRIPLIQIARTGTSACGNVRVHQLVSQYVLYQMRSGLRQTPPLTAVLDLLVARDDWRRATDLVAILGRDDAIVAFVERHGHSMIESEQWQNLLRLMGYTNPASVLGSAVSLLSWAQALHLKGSLDDALAKAAAAHALAIHDGDHLTCAQASSLRLRILVEQGRAAEAIQNAEKCLGQYGQRLSNEPLAELLAQHAVALATVGRAGEARRTLEDARRVVEESDRGIATIERIASRLDVSWTGDWEKTVSLLSPVCDGPDSSAQALRHKRGHLALALAETARLDRASALAGLVLQQAHPRDDAAFGSAAALVAAARAEYSDGVDILRRVRRSANAVGDVRNATITLLFQSVIQRAAGGYRESLVSAERASERLVSCDHFTMSRLAFVEVAASHAALGDYPVAQEWLDKANECGDTRNGYELLAVAAVAAVVSRRTGSSTSPLLSELTDYIASGSASWRLAMYCRTFPELLGILVDQVGVAALPGRMLDLLSIQGASECLQVSASWMDQVDHESLTNRLLGPQKRTSERAQEVAPRCVVGFFGGLTVEVDGRKIEDRDWGKRKARQLFAMLVARRGHEIPRDQILEHLWPELDEERAKNNFYVAWSSMKAALAPPEAAGPCQYAESKHGRCRARVEAVRSDLDDFDEVVRELKRAIEYDESGCVVDAAERLMALYRGEFLPGDLYDDWFEQVRADYRGQFVSAMTLAAEHMISKGQHVDALRCAGQVLQLDPLREDLYQLAMKAHLELGQRNGAIEMFTRCKTHLVDELGLDPSDVTMGLYQRGLELV